MNIAVDYLSAQGNGERFPALAAECLRLKADVIAVSTTPAAQAANVTDFGGLMAYERCHSARRELRLTGY